MEKAMAPHSSTLAWEIPWMEEPGGLQSMGSQRVRHNWSDLAAAGAENSMEKEMATHSSVLAWRIPGTGEPGGLPSVGSHRVRHDWSDLAAAAENSTPECALQQWPRENAQARVTSDSLRRWAVAVLCRLKSKEVRHGPGALTVTSLFLWCWWDLGMAGAKWWCLIIWDNVEIITLMSLRLEWSSRGFISNS